MKSKMLLTLLAGLLLVLPGMAWGANSIILESKTLAPNLNGTPAFTVKVSITNDDSLSFLTLVLAEQNSAGTAYALLNSPRTYAGTINNLTNSLKFFSAINAVSYNDNSPDSVLWAAGFDPTDRDNTLEPPNASPKAVWEIKFKHTSDSLGQVTLRAVNGTIAGQSNTFTDQVPTDHKNIPVTPGILTIVETCNFSNCPPPNTNVLYGRPFSYDFNNDKEGTGTYSVAVGPGSIDPNTGVYSFAGQCPLGDIPVDVHFTSRLGAQCDCQFVLHIIDNAPSCTPASPTVSVSHGSAAANHINTSDPDAGDNVSVAQTSGPGTTTPGGDWSYQTSCADVGASPQTVQEQVVDGFGNCQPGPLSATCQFQLVVTNAPPSITCPPNAQVQAGSAYNACPVASDPDAADNGNLNFSGNAVPPITGFAVNPSTGCVSAAPTVADAGPHTITLVATDLCGAQSRCTYTLTVVVGAKFHICIDTIRAFQGTDVEVSIRNLNEATDPSLANGHDVGGFSFLLSYDCSCLQFLSARKGAFLVNHRWEFFTFRFGAIGNGNCGAGCPSCLIRVVAIADVNNGATHPIFDRTNAGEWVVLKFRTSNDRKLAGQCCAISWFWFDCTDNTVSDSTGNQLWVADSLLTAGGSPIDLASAFPINVANCDQFQTNPDKPKAKKFIVFCNGQICLPTPEEIDDRGDLNLNNLKNEIADAVLYENYFIYGPSVLSSDPTRRQSQIAASDVNGDGTVLSVADLVFMIRIITGDAQPLPRMNPAAGAVSLNMTSAGSELTLSANSASDLGGLYLKFRVDGAVGTPVLSGAAEGMTLKSNQIGNELSVLIYSESKSQMIAPNAGAILKMKVEGSAELIESEAADYFGIALPTLSKAAALPTSFGLSQNYPNPFNGKTTIKLALPVASDYKVTVYNVAGQVVKTFEGSAPAGNRTIVWDGTDRNGTAVSSGVYFYKAVAGSYSATLKMLYLK